MCWLRVDLWVGDQRKLGPWDSGLMDGCAGDGWVGWQVGRWAGVSVGRLVGGPVGWWVGRQMGRWVVGCWTMYRVKFLLTTNFSMKILLTFYQYFYWRCVFTLHTSTVPTAISFTKHFLHLLSELRAHNNILGLVPQAVVMKLDCTNPGGRNDKFMG